MSDYTEHDIQILDPIEIEGRWEWTDAEALAFRYQCSPAWVQRGLRACREAGVPTAYFVARYLDRDPSVPKRLDAEEAFVRALREGREQG
jgi:hypothetical protein